MTNRLTQDLLFFLECPSCLEYMTQKIFVCLTGHSLCMVCWRKLNRCPECRKPLSETRNFTLESVARTVRFPCLHSDHGCREVFLSNQLDDHVVFCSFRDYQCRVQKCKWEGKRYQISDHWQEYHKEETLAGNSNVCYWNNLKKNQVELLSAHNEIFFFHKKVFGKNLHFVVQYIGRDEDVIQYIFKVTIYSEEYAHRKIEITENCHNDHLVDINEIIDSGFTASVAINNLDTYSSPPHGNRYKIEILKI